MKQSMLLILLLAGAVVWAAAVPQSAQLPSFATPQDAAQALIEAAAQNGTAAMLKLFGPEGRDIVQSGDPAEDKRMRQEFVARAKVKLNIETEPGNPDWARIVVGDNDWPFPVPLVRSNGQWRFDAAQGRMEVLARRIGRHELTAIEVCRGYVEAQMDYAAHDRDSGGVLQYAQKIISSPGKKDGLYQEGEPDSLVPKAFAEAAVGMLPSGAQKPVPYHGYYFQILKAQGPEAPGGEMDYVVKGKMIGGFAMVAWPADYGVSGIKTFLVSHQGTVYEKDLGPETSKLAPSITRFNPDKTWGPVQGE